MYFKIKNILNTITIKIKKKNQERNQKIHDGSDMN
jgi:hypothetical protein